MVENAKTLKPIDVPTEDIEAPEGSANEAGLLPNEPGTKDPDEKPARAVEGIHLKSVRNIRIELGKLYRLWWAGKVSKADMDAGRKMLETMLKAKAVELEAEHAGRDDETKLKSFAGLKITHAPKDGAKQRGEN